MLLTQWREINFVQSAIKDGFSGSDMRQYFIFTEIYRILASVFTTIAVWYMCSPGLTIVAWVWSAWWAYIALGALSTVATFARAECDVFDKQLEILKSEHQKVKAGE